MKLADPTSMSHSRSERKGMTRRNGCGECAGRRDKALSLLEKVAGDARLRSFELVQSAGNVGIDRRASGSFDHPAETTVVIGIAARTV